MTQQNKQLPGQNIRRYLACFQPRFGILKIEGKKEKGRHHAAFSHALESADATGRANHPTPCGTVVPHRECAPSLCVPQVRSDLSREPPQGPAAPHASKRCSEAACFQPDASAQKNSSRNLSNPTTCRSPAPQRGGPFLNDWQRKVDSARNESEPFRFHARNATASTVSPPPGRPALRLARAPNRSFPPRI
jgi:hypothetical protein